MIVPFKKILIFRLSILLPTNTNGKSQTQQETTSTEPVRNVKTLSLQDHTLFFFPMAAGNALITQLTGLKDMLQLSLMTKQKSLSLFHSY